MFWRESQATKVYRKGHTLCSATTNLNFTQAEIGVYYPVSCKKIRHGFWLFF